jgi:hypothetical protein
VRRHHSSQRFPSKRSARWAPAFEPHRQRGLTSDGGTGLASSVRAGSLRPSLPPPAGVTPRGGRPWALGPAAASCVFLCQVVIARKESGRGSRGAPSAAEARWARSGALSARLSMRAGKNNVEGRRLPSDRLWFCEPEKRAATKLLRRRRVLTGCRRVILAIVEVTPGDRPGGTSLARSGRSCC